MRPQLIKAVLIDDELHCTASLAIHLQELNYNVTVVKSFNKANDALDFLQQQPEIDLVFLDIEMPGLSGFDILEQLNNISFDVIFVTAYNQYAINAFKYSAFDYLLKPVEDIELSQCIGRWKEKKKNGIEKPQLAFLKELLYQQQNRPAKLALPTTEGLAFVTIDHITRCQSDSNYTHFHLADGENLMICKTLKDVESALTPYGFIRIHQSHLVNPKYIQKLVKNDGGYLVMNDSSQLRISKSKKEAVLNAFNMIG
ncbi:LytR/AlgR family response regulator transcription factor [Pedobacter helvus]|uniref:LytR/AlgR family response regulator transcription factor n=1 Tax=Pedobacter helvus TaxID=2563444 RepID=A0ABW9JED9_9SPHI|nr:LytTR family DNA-binding domain-containing protein [Pedobacter ureilyticus]